MNAQEARDIASQNNLSDYPSIQDRILEAANEGKRSIWWYKVLTQEVYDKLTLEDDFIFDEMQIGHNTVTIKISW